MENKQLKAQINWIYWGTLISSLGTFTFPGATIGILTQLDFPIWKIGLLMGLTRAGSLLGSLLLGDLSDRYDSKVVVLVTELLAIVLSIFLIFSWSLGTNFFYFFALCVFLRFFVISIGSPGRNKLLKVLVEKYNGNHFHSAITLNTVTHGPGVVGAIIGFFAIKYFSYYWVLIFDAITFIINGIILVIFVKQKNDSLSRVREGFLRKFEIYSANKNLMLFDILLCLPFLGTNVLMSRLSEGEGHRVPLLLATFGLGAILSPQILKFGVNRYSNITGYVLIGCSFLGLLLFRNSFYLVLFWVLIRNVGYWYLYNLYTGYFQVRCNSNNLASLFAARTFVITSTLGLGEILFGFIGQHLHLNGDIILRLTITSLIAAMTIRLRDV